MLKLIAGILNTMGSEIDGTVVVAEFNGIVQGNMSRWADIVQMIVGFDTLYILIA